MFKRSKISVAVALALSGAASSDGGHCCLRAASCKRECKFRPLN